MNPSKTMKNNRGSGLTADQQTEQPEAGQQAAAAAAPLAIYRMIGMATRAGRTTTGTEAGIKAISHGRAFLVILAEDTAENTREQLTRAADRNQVKLAGFGSKEELGRWTGHPERAVVVLTDQGFAARIIELMGTWNKSFHEGQLEEKG